MYTSTTVGRLIAISAMNFIFLEMDNGSPNYLISIIRRAGEEEV